MAEERVESPTLEKPETPAETVPTGTEKEREDLLKKLESLQVKDAQQLDNMAYASYQAGKYAEELGSVRAELSALRQEQAQRGRPNQSFDEYQEGQTVNLDDAIEKGILKVVNKMGAQQQQVNQWHQNALAKVRTDKRYHMVAKEFEDKVRDPLVWQRLNQGESYFDIYSETLIGKLEETLGQSYQALKGSSSRPSQMNPPHMETGNTVSTPGQSPSENKNQQLRELETEHRAGRINDRDYVLRKIELETDINDSIFRPG